MRRTSGALFLAGLFFWASVSVARAAGIEYVSTTGSDIASCTARYPCATLGKALALATAGTVVNMMPGTYGGQTVTAVGTVANPIIVNGGQAVTITYPSGASAVQQSQPLVTILNSANVVFEEVSVVGMVGRGDIISGSPVSPAEIVVSDTGTIGSGIVISSVVVNNSTGDGIAVVGGEAVTITNSALATDGTPTSPSISIPAQNGVVARVMISDTQGPGIWVSGASGITTTVIPSVVMSSTIYNPQQISGAIGISATGNAVVLAANKAFGTDGGFYIAGNGARVQDNTAQNAGAFHIPYSYSVGWGVGIGVYNNYSLSGGGSAADLLIGATGVASATLVENNQFVGGQYFTSIMTTSSAYNTSADYNEYATFSSNPSHPSSAPYCSTTGLVAGVTTYGYCTDPQGNTLYGTHSFSGTLSNGSATWPGVAKEEFAQGTVGNAFVFTAAANQATGINVGIPYTGTAPDIGPYCLESCVYTTTYYVSPSGTDNNPCTLALPCGTIARVSSMTNPGDVIILLPGTYYQIVNLISAGGEQPSPSSGSPEWPVTLQGEGGVTITYPISSSQATQALSLWNDAGEYKTFNNIVFLGMLNRPDWIPQHYSGPQGAQLVYMNDTPNFMTFNGISVLNSESTGLDCYSFCHVYHSTFINDGQDNDANLHPIYFPGSNNIVATSYISGTAGYGVHMHAAGGAEGNNYVISNTILNAGNSGIVVDSVPATITGNILIDNRGGGIQASVGGLNIYHNLFVNDGWNGGYDVTIDGPNVSVVNNTFYHDGGGGGNPLGAFSIVGASALTLLNNVLYDSNDPNFFITAYGPYSPTVGDTFAGNVAWVVGGVTPLYGQKGMALTDPLFVNTALAASGGLQLQSDSPAVGAGAPIPAIDLALYDGWGGTAPDAGYYCFNCGAAIPIVRSPGPQSWYLSPTGSDATTACTASAPCSNFQNVQALAQPGDNIILQSGVYTSPLIVNVPNLSIAGSGAVTVTYPLTPNALLSAQQVVGSRTVPRIIFNDALTETVTGIVFDGGAQSAGYVTSTANTPLVWADAMNAIMPGALTFKNVIIQNNGSEVCLAFGSTGFSFSHVVVQGCGGIGLGPNDNVTIDQSTFSNISATGFDLASTPPVTTTGEFPVRITNSTFSGAFARDTAFLAIGGNNSQFSNNTVSGAMAALLPMGTSHALITNNLFWYSGDGSGGSIDDMGANDLIANNTIVGSAYAISFSYGYPGWGSSGAVIKNNIYSIGWSIGFFRPGTTYNVTADYNLIDSPAASSSLITTTPDAQGNLFYLPHDIFAHPGFAADGHSLLATSAAVGSGTNVGLPYQSPAPDLGNSPYRTAFDTNVLSSGLTGGHGGNGNATLLLILLGLAGSASVGFYGLGTRIRRASN